MIRVVAVEEIGPLLKAKRANSCYLRHWYILSLLRQRFGFQHISLNDVLYEKSDDQTYLHAGFLRDCLDEKIEVPRELKISFLERKINEGVEGGKKWSIVHGFPECIQELFEFEEKVGLFHVN